MSQAHASLTALDTVSHLWRHLCLPDHALSSLRLSGSGSGFPSSFKVGPLAQASIALSGLTAGLFHSLRGENAGSSESSTPSREGALLRVPGVSIPLDHACAEFLSERLYTLNGIGMKIERFPIGGLHRTNDGYVRIHDGFRRHRVAALEILGLEEDASRQEIKMQLLQWRALELEQEGFRRGAVILKLRGTEEWDSTAQGRAVGGFPISISRIAVGPRGLKKRLGGRRDKCLRGLRVVELTRVIAAPVAGRTLAAHGADVLWVTSPKLEHQPSLDIDTARGKRVVQLDLNTQSDNEKLWGLLEEADVFLQSYRPGSLARRGFSAEEIMKRSKEGIVIAELSAFGFEGPWKDNRGFDSMVQNCSGINVGEAERYGDGEVARVLPCQALDHASGYFLAAGIEAALYRQAVDGGSYRVQNSLAGTMKYLRSLGQYEGKSGFECSGPENRRDLPDDFFESHETEDGELRAVKHAAQIDGVDVGCESTPSTTDCGGWKD